MRDLDSKKSNSGIIERYARILVPIAVVFGATSGPIAKSVTAPAIAIGFWRLTMSLPFFGLPLLINPLIEKWKLQKRVAENRGGAIDEVEDPGQAMQHRSRDIAITALAGVFLCAHFICWFQAVKTTNISSASVLATLHPLVVLAISILIYQKRIAGKAIFGILLALSGAVITAGFDYKALANSYIIGDIFALGAAFFMGLYFAIGEKVRERMPGNKYVFILFFFCWLSFLATMIISGTAFAGYPIRDYLLIFLMAVLCQVCSHAVFNLCLGKVDSVYVSAWETCDPVFGILMAFITLGQIPTLWSIIGCVIVIIGLTIYNSSSLHNDTE